MVLQLKKEIKKIGQYEIAYLDNSSVELICNLKAYRDIDLIIKDDNKLMLVMEAADE